MSLILDALSRSERERRAQAEGVPDLLLAPAQPPTASRRGRYWALAVVLLCVAAGGAYLLQQRDDAGEQPPAPAERVVAASAALPGAQQPGEAAGSGVISKEAPARAALPEASELAVSRGTGDARGTLDDSAGDDAVRALYASRQRASETAPESPEHPAAGDRGAELATLAETPPETRPVQGPEPRAASPADDAVAAETPVDLEQVLQAARENLADRGLSPHATPTLASLSQQFRDRVPTLMYLKHDYASDGRASVVINGTTLRAGQRIDGVTLREVLPDSAIFSLDGQDFRLRALNSWVNL